MGHRNMRSRRDELDSTRRERLESIGFVWDALDQQWEEMFAKLEEYRRSERGLSRPTALQRGPITWKMGNEHSAVDVTSLIQPVAKD